MTDLFFYYCVFLHFRWKDPCPDLQGDALDALQKSFADVELLVIDEKSMVSAIHKKKLISNLHKARKFKDLKLILVQGELHTKKLIPPDFDDF